jgi:hypothetical protein
MAALQCRGEVGDQGGQARQDQVLLRAVQGRGAVPEAGWPGPRGRPAACALRRGTRGLLRGLYGLVFL